MPSFVYFLIAGFILAILSPWREGFFDLGGTIWDITMGLIARFFLLAVFSFVLWGLWIFVCWLVASWTNSPVAGIIFGALSPIWVIMLIIATIKGKGGGTGWVGFILLIATSVLAFSYYSPFPKIQGAIANYGSKGEIKIANALNKKALQMEPEGILSATALEDSVFYNDKGIPKGTEVKKGDELRTMDLAQVQFEKDPEQFVRVMKKNKKGHFRGGEVGYVPVRILFFGDEKKPERKLAVKTPPEKSSAKKPREKRGEIERWTKIGELVISDNQFPADLGGITGGKFLPEKKYRVVPEGMDPENDFQIPGLYLRFYSGRPGEWTDIPTKQEFALDVAGLMVCGIGSREWIGKIHLYEKEV